MCAGHWARTALLPQRRSFTVQHRRRAATVMPANYVICIHIISYNYALNVHLNGKIILDNLHTVLGLQDRFSASPM